MKRRYANYINGTMKQFHLDEDFFRGELCFIDIEDDRKPEYVKNGIHEVCYIAKDYRWLIAYPERQNYVMTVVYDDLHKIVEWYFDVSKKIGVTNGIPYEDDLYLDLVITADGKSLVLDEDELLSAYKSKEIDDEDLKLAYSVIDYLEAKFSKDVTYLKDLTDKLNKYYDKE